MKEQFIQFETAKLAKEKGFNVYQNKCYDPLCNDVNHLYDYYYESRMTVSTQERKDRLIFAPTQSLLKKWLRENHQVYVELRSEFYITGINFLWQVLIYDPKDTIAYSDKSTGLYGEYNTYEKALEEGLKRALTLI